MNGLYPVAPSLGERTGLGRLLAIQPPLFRGSALILIQLNRGAVGTAATLQVQDTVRGWLRLDFEPPLPQIDELKALAGCAVVGSNLDFSAVGGEATILFELFSQSILRDELEVITA